MGIEIFFEMFLAWGEFYSNSPVASICRNFPGFHQVLVVKVIEQGLQFCWCKAIKKKGIYHSTLTARNRHKLVDPWLSPKDTCEWKRWRWTNGAIGKWKRQTLSPSTFHAPPKVLCAKHPNKTTKRTIDKSKSFQIPPNQKHLCWKKNLWTIRAISRLYEQHYYQVKKKRNQVSLRWLRIPGIFSIESDFQVLKPSSVASMSKSPKRSRAAWTEVAINGASSQVAQTEGNWCGPTAGFLGGNNRNDSKAVVQKTPKASTVARPNRLCRAWRCRFMKIEDKS